ALADPVRAPLIRRGHRPVAEDRLLQRLDLVVDPLDRVEVGVHHVVEQAVQEEHHPVRREARLFVPPADHLVDREVRLPDGHQDVAGDERGRLGDAQPARPRVEPGGVHAEEEVPVVGVELRPLPALDRVLHGELVDAQLRAEGLELLPAGRAQVEPHHRRRIPDQAGDLGGREALRRQRPVAVQPGTCHVRQAYRAPGTPGGTTPRCYRGVNFARRVRSLNLLPFAVLAAAPAHADEAPGRITATEVTMELRADGVLHVKESVTLAGGPVQRKLITRTRYDDTRDRLYRISNVKGASFDGQTLTMAKSGTVEYDVTGAVTPLPGSVELRWFPVAGDRK